MRQDLKNRRFEKISKIVNNILTSSFTKTK